MKIKMLALELAFCCFFSCIFFANFSKKIVFNDIGYIEIENLTGEAGGSNCNFWVEGLKLQEIDGFIELEEGHYVADSTGAKIRFEIEDTSKIRINAAIMEPMGSILKIRGWQDRDISLYSETSDYEYIDLSAGKIELFGIIQFAISLFLLLGIQVIKKIEKKELILWLIFLGMGLAFYGYNFKNTYGCDDIPTYALEGMGMENKLKSNSFSMYVQTLGRPVAGILFLIFGEIFRMCSLSVHAVFNQQLLAFSVIVLYAFCAYVMYKITDFCVFGGVLGEGHILRKIVNVITCCCFLYNPFFSDMMYFKGANLYFSFAILFNLLAARIFVESKGDVFNRNGIWIFFWGALGAFTYQPMGAYFVIFSLLGVLAQYLKHICEGKDVLRKGFACLCLYGGPYLLNLLYTNFMGSVQSNRIPKFNMRILLDTFPKGWEYLKEYWLTGAGYMRPKYFLAISAFFYAIIIMLCFLRKKKIMMNIGLCSCFLAISYCIVFYFNLFTKNLWSIDARTSTAFGGFPALELILVVIIGEEIEKSEMRKKSINFAIASGVMLCVFYYVDVLENANKILITSALDACSGQFYADEIKRYEAETGNTITKIGFSEDTAVTYCYRYGFEQISCAPFWRSSYISWSKNRIIEIYLDYRTLRIIDIPKEIQDLAFAGKNWNGLSTEQIFFEGDTVYICMY